jgi:uncharacterized membrane protein
MGKLNLSIGINAKTETVFDVISDIENSPDRIEWYENVEMLTDGPVGVGTKWRETRVMNDRQSFEDWELTEFDRPNYFSAYCDSQGYDVNYTMSVQPEGGSSKLSINMTTKPRTIIGKLMTPLEWMMAGMMRKIVFKDLESLKAYIERNSSP